MMRISKIPFPILIVLHWIFLFHNIILVSGICHDHQQSLLLQLKNDLNFSHVSAIKLVSWNQSQECCQWTGVTCDNEGHVTGLDLSKESISGILENSSSLFDLQYLQMLNLAYNNFHFVFPSKFYKLKDLTYLNLSNAGFEGQIPLEISHLTRLFTLDMSTDIAPSKLKLENPNLQMLVQNLTSIRRLYLDGVSISDMGQEWCSALSLLSSLEELSLSRCNLSGPIDSCLGRLKQLRIIHLNQNNLSGPVPELLANFSNLASLQFSDCGLSGRFPQQVFQLRTLTMIDISYNNDLHGSFQDFPLNGSLQSLIVSNTGFSGTLPDSLEEPMQKPSDNLFLLDLHHNNLRGSLPTFPKNATYLDFSRNNFSSVVPPDIGYHLSATIFLSLSHNNFYGQIPDSMCDASNLQVLDLSSNEFEGTIPPCLSNIETLGVLSLRKNRLTGSIPDTFPLSCALRTLDVKQNELDGVIPKSLANCVTLEVLDLGSNQINDVFPCMLKNISTLRVLVLRTNRFQGPIGCPNTNGTWNMLQIVDLAFNNFSGSLPGRIFLTWTMMMSEENQAASEVNRIRFQVGGFNGLYYQDVVSVTYKGRQMRLVKILTVFTSIDFSHNHFEGPIPKELMYFKALYVLNLSHNALSGQIPSSIGNLKKLESLDLSGNFLRGKIPSQLATLTFLSFLNLSFNHLVGKIPTGTQLQTFEASSFEGNDGLYGPPLTASSDNQVHVLSPPSPTGSGRSLEIDWNILSVELGLIFGLGIVIVPLLYCKQWRVRYWNRVDNILCYIFLRLLHLEFENHGGQTNMILRLRNNHCHDL
ncbi:Leucine-rich repeat [Sesbania bispinosa]|nr:Leucine-rich repeat [Sesbania bispinosa]